MKENTRTGNPYVFTLLTDFDSIITDWDCVEDQVAALEVKGINVIMVEDPNE